jgi:methionine synthase I (cobalamin-dependent)
MLVCSNPELLDVMGGYDDTPEDMARDNEKFFENGWLTMVVGTPFTQQTIHPFLPNVG